MSPGKESTSGIACVKGDVYHIIIALVNLSIGDITESDRLPVYHIIIALVNPSIGDITGSDRLPV